MDTRETDKDRTKCGKSLATITFDIQAVLPLPHAGDAQIYYMCKLSVYNFTIYMVCHNYRDP